ncbi:MAG: GyrI-like domain-containing protein [Pseudomonadota bacterium]
MQKQKVELNEIMLVGLTVRTNNKNEMDPATSKIAALVGSYMESQSANEIKHRLNPGVTYSAYTDYESDEHGDYTYFIGEAVESFVDQDLTKFKTLTVPQGQFQKFTTDAGKMPDVVISAWQAIWKMDATELGGERNYQFDFEIYDVRASDQNNMVLDIYIGLKS